MRPISRLSEVQRNVRTLRSYLADPRSVDARFAKALVRDGICFVVTRDRGGAFFVPSRFVGYANNSRRAHVQNDTKYGGETNEALITLSGSKPKPSQRMEREYREFCATLGIIPRPTESFGVIRQFWDLR